MRQRKYNTGLRPGAIIEQKRTHWALTAGGRIETFPSLEAALWVCRNIFDSEPIVIFNGGA